MASGEVGRGGRSGLRNVVVALGLVVVSALLVFFVETPLTLQARHAVHTALKPAAMAATLEIDGVGPIQLFLNEEDRVVTPWFWAGRKWEENETRWFVETVRPGDVVVDVGANVGYYTLIAGKLVGDEGRVYAFEPDPKGFELLQRNVRLNGLDNVIVEQKAVSNENGTLRLFLSEENKGDHRVYDPDGEGRASVEVDAVRLDDYFDGVEESVDFVKIDTQGAEFAILEGMQETLRTSDDVVMAIEYSPRHLAGFGATGIQVIQLLNQLRFSMYDLGLGPVAPLRPTAPRYLIQMKPDAARFTNLLLVKGRPELEARIQERWDDYVEDLRAEKEAAPGGSDEPAPPSVAP